MIEHPFLKRAVNLPDLATRTRWYIEEGLRQSIARGDNEAIRDWMDALETEEALASLAAIASMN